MTETKWMLQTKRADFDGISARYHISPVTARIIRNRDVVGDEAIERYLYGGLECLHSPHLMKDMDLAAQLLMAACGEKKKIRIVGDYDIDGVCSTYLLLMGLREIGADADYRIPDRIKDGYGMNEMIIREAYEDGIDVILTCDNGISAIDQVALGKELGMTVIVTDHHDIRMDGEREILPCADAVVNPKQSACGYPYPEICGGLVAYKLVQVLFERAGVPMKKWEELLEFAAIATVGDVMKLQDENRIVVKYGLKRLGMTDNLGLQKLIEKNNLDPGALTAYHIGFVIGPCINAGGRLQTAKLALELFLSKDMETADRLALELKELNDERKDMTQRGLETAAAQVDEYYGNDKVLVVYLPDCHESLAGIIAGRLRERYQKPSIVLTDAESGVKGSGRSIEAYHMFQELSRVQELLTKFGGHPMAAGLSLERDRIDEFRRRLNENAQLTQDDFIPKVWIDVPMPLEYVSESLVRELELLEPFGQGNEKPQFAQKDLRIRNLRVLGKNRNAVKCSLVTPQGLAMDAMLFGDGDAFLEEAGGMKTMDIVYYPSVNEYNGNKSLQVVIRWYRLH